MRTIVLSHQPGQNNPVSDVFRPSAGLREVRRILLHFRSTRDENVIVVEVHFDGELRDGIESSDASVMEDILDKGLPPWSSRHRPKATRIIARFLGLVRNQPIDAVDNNELNLTLLGFEIQTELLPESGKD